MLRADCHGSHVARVTAGQIGSKVAAIYGGSWRFMAGNGEDWSWWMGIGVGVTQLQQTVYGAENGKTGRRRKIGVTEVDGMSA